MWTYAYVASVFEQAFCQEKCDKASRSSSLFSVPFPFTAEEETRGKESCKDP